MSVIDQRDKHRFGEDSTQMVVENARRRAASLKAEFHVDDRSIALGGFRVEYVDGAAKTPHGSLPMGEEEWEIFKGLLLNFFASNGKTPTRRELREIYFAATGREPPGGDT